MKEIWLSKRGECEWIRYTLNPYDCIKLYAGDGNYTRAFRLHKQWKSNTDEWKPFGGDYAESSIFVEIITLLSEFTVLDSINDNYIKGLETLRDNNFKKETETNINLFTNMMADIQAPSEKEVDGVYEVTNNGKNIAPAGQLTDIDKLIEETREKPKKDERHQKDFCTLHSRESETNEERPTEGVQK